MADTPKIIVEAQLDQKVSEKNIQDGLERIQKNLEPIMAKLQIDDGALKSFKTIADNIESLINLSKQLEDSMTRTATTMKVNDDGSVTKIVQKWTQFGEIIEKTNNDFKGSTAMIGEVTDAINKQGQAQEKLNQAQVEYNKLLSDGEYLRKKVFLDANNKPYGASVTMLDPEGNSQFKTKKIDTQLVDGEVSVTGITQDHNRQAEIKAEIAFEKALEDTVIKTDAELDKLIAKFRELQAIGRYSDSSIGGLIDKAEGMKGLGSISTVQQLQEELSYYQRMEDFFKQRMVDANIENKAWDERDQKIKAEQAELQKILDLDVKITELFDKMSNLSANSKYMPENNNILGMQGNALDLLGTGNVDGLKQLESEYNNLVDLIAKAVTEKKMLDEAYATNAKIDAQKQTDSIKEQTKWWEQTKKDVDTVNTAIGQLIMTMDKWAETSSYIPQDFDKIRNSALGLVGTQDVNAIKQLEAEYKSVLDVIKQVEQADAEESARKQAELKAEQQYLAEQEKALKESVNKQISIISARYKAEVTNAGETLIALRNVYRQNTDYFKQNIDEQMKMLNEMKTLEDQIAKGNGGKGHSGQIMNHTGFGLGPLEMTQMMIGFQGTLAVLENLKIGMVDVQKSAAGLNQVFFEGQASQQGLESTTNQFIDVAKKLGVSITEVTDAAKLWGRQYSDNVDETLKLTQASTMLSVVDNVKVADANRAVESSMQAMGMTIKDTGNKAQDAARAYSTAMKFIDSWTAVSHSAAVSAQDLTQGFERSAAAAHQAGLSVDQLNALVAAGVRNTGRSGAVIGNMLKSVFANIESGSPKVVDAFKQLGISMTETGKNGITQMKPVYDLMLELSQKMENGTVASNKYFEAIAGGKYQFDSLEASLSNTKAIQDAYNASIKSGGDTQKLATAQLDTFNAQLQRLQDTIQQAAYNQTSNNGLFQLFTQLIKGVTDFINVLGHVPKTTYDTIAVIGGLILGVKTLKGTWDMLSGAINSFQGIVSKGLVLFDDLSSAFKGQAMLTTEQIARYEMLTGAEADATIGARGLAAAMSTIDIETGGLLLVLGVAVTWILSLANANVKAEESMKTLDDKTQQITMDAQQYTDKITNQTYNLVQNSNTIKTLGDNYVNLTKQLSTLKQGTDQYKNTQDQLMVVKSQLMPLLDKEGQKALNNAHDYQTITKVLEELRQEQIQDTISQLENDQKQIDSDNKKTNAILTNTTKIINSYEQRIQALQVDNSKVATPSFSKNPLGYIGNGLKNWAQEFTGGLVFGKSDMQKTFDNNLQSKQLSDKLSSLEQIAKNKQAEISANDSKKSTIDQNINQLKADLQWLKDHPDGTIQDPTQMGYGGTSKNSTVGSDFGTGSASKKKKSAKTVNPLSNYLANNPDANTKDILDAANAYDQAATNAKKYTEGSPQYTEALEKEKTALQDKQRAIKDDIDYTNNQISALKKLKDATKDQTQKNQIQKQINTDNTRVKQLGDSVTKLGTSIQAIDNNIQKSKVDGYFGSMNKNITTTSTNIDDVKNKLDSITSTDVASMNEKNKLTGQLVDLYRQQSTQINNAITALKKEATQWPKNSEGYKEVESQLKSLQTQADSTASAMKTLGDSIKSDLLSQIDSVLQAEKDALTNAKQTADDTIKKLQSEKNTFDFSDWQSQMANVNNSIDETDGKFQQIDNTFSKSSITSDLKTWNDSLATWIGTLTQFQNTNPTTTDEYQNQIATEISSYKSLEQALKDVNVQIQQKTLLYQQQEDALSEEIKTEQAGYDAQIKALQDQLKLLNDTYSAQDRLSSLQDAEQKLKNALSDKQYKYIDSQGKEVLSYNKDAVEQAQDAYDKLIQSYQRDDMKNAIQNQIDSLNNAKTAQTDALQQQLDNLKEYHTLDLQAMNDYKTNLNTVLQNINSDISDKTSMMDQLFSDESTSLDNSFGALKKAIQDGTGNITTLLAGSDGKTGWFGQIISFAKQFNIDLGAQVQQMVLDVNQLSLLAGQASNLNPTTVGTGGTTIGNIGGSALTGAGLSASGGMAGIASGIGRMTIQKFHEGGVVGSVSNPMSDLVNKLFNAKPNEQIIKALVGEITTTPSNIMNNFIPSMKNVAGLMSGASNKAQTNQTVHQYVFQNMTVQTESASDFFDQIKHLTMSEIK